jgi:hypothetical protein
VKGGVGVRGRNVYSCPPLLLKEKKIQSLEKSFDFYFLIFIFLENLFFEKFVVLYFLRF